MLLEDLLKEFLFELQIQNYSRRTIDTYRYNVNQFIMYVKELEIEELDDVLPVHIKKFIKHQQALGNKASYINVLIKSLRAYFKYLKKEDYLDVDLMKKITLLKEDVTIIETFTDNEIKAMLNVYDFKTYLNARNKMIIALFVDTGIRMSELINLQYEWIGESTIKIFGKGKKWRYVSISLNLKKYMIRYERMRESYFKDKILENNNYILSRSGRPLTSVQVENIVRDCGKKAKVRDTVRCSPHTLRHYFSQANIRNGLDVYSTSRLLGHSNINITKRYLQSIQDDTILELATTTSPLANIKGVK